MTAMSVKNNTASDMVISPGTRIGNMDIVTGRDTPVCQDTREEYCSDPRVQSELKHYASTPDPKQQEKAEQIRVGIDSFTPETDLAVGDWRRELNYDVPSMTREVWKYELRDDYCRFLERYDSVLGFGL